MAWVNGMKVIDLTTGDLANMLKAWLEKICRQKSAEAIVPLRAKVGRAEP
jgi:hypothetical protein